MVHAALSIRLGDKVFKNSSFSTSAHFSFTFAIEFDNGLLAYECAVMICKFYCKRCFNSKELFKDGCSRWKGGAFSTSSILRTLSRSTRCPRHLFLYSNGVISEKTVQDCFTKKDIRHLEDDPALDDYLCLRDDHLKALLKKDDRQTTRKLTETMGCSQNRR